MLTGSQDILPCNSAAQITGETSPGIMYEPVQGKKIRWKPMSARYKLTRRMDSIFYKGQHKVFNLFSTAKYG